LGHSERRATLWLHMRYDYHDMISCDASLAVRFLNSLAKMVLGNTNTQNMKDVSYRDVFAVSYSNLDEARATTISAVVYNMRGASECLHSREV